MNDLRGWLAVQAETAYDLGTGYAGQGNPERAAHFFGKAAAYRQVLAWLDHDRADAPSSDEFMSYLLGGAS